MGRGRNQTGESAKDYYYYCANWNDYKRYLGVIGLMDENVFVGDGGDGR